MSTETKLEKRPCTCCAVFHDPNLCAQCQVAGCATKGKKEKCRLQGTLIEARTLSKFQLEALVVELRKQNAELLAEAQRLARIVHETPEAARKLNHPATFSLTGKTEEAIAR